MKNFSRLLLCCAILLSAQVCLAQDKDAEGCKDSALIGRFLGSVLTSCKDSADDSFKFTLDKGGPKAVEGEFHQIVYQFPKTASKAQVVRNLNTAIRKAGYTMVYDSGEYGDFTGHMGKTWIQIEIGGGGGITETIVIETQLTQDVVANAAELGGSLATSGHTVVNGILFDTGKADVKPESAAALEEVSKLLEEDPKLKLYVVGHTDNVGILASNMDLSKRRAAAVVQLLITKYGIAADRLSPYGDGPYAPLVSNNTEDGRTTNRRVELVKQ
jgi:OOP family OmpA-OmpF porin